MNRRSWAGVLTAAAAVRALVAFVLLGKMPMMHDAQSYVEEAAKLVADFPGHDAYYWPPGNPCALAATFALFGQSVAAARALMIAFGVAQVGMTALVAGRLAGEKAARAAGWMAALYVPALLLAGQSYSQHLGALCVTASAYFAVRALEQRRAWLFAAAGIALGVGAITRPSMVTVAPVLAFAFVYRRRLWVGAAIFAVAAAAIVAPVLAHNHAHDAGWVVSTNNERNFFLGNNPYTPDYKTSHLGQRSLDEVDPETRAYLESFYRRPDAREAMQKEALAYMVAHPLVTLYRMLNRATSFWGFDYLGSRIVQEHFGWGKKGFVPLLSIEVASYAFVATFALVAIFAPARGDPTWTRWLLATIVAYEAPYVIAFSGGTYHFPVMGIVIAFAGSTIADAKEAGARTAKGKAAIAALAVFAIVQAEYAYYSLRMSGA